MVGKGLEGISPVGRMKCVVIIREHSGFGRNRYIRVIDMTKLQNIETTYRRVQLEKSTSPKVIPRCPGYLYTSDPATRYLSPAILFPRHSYLTRESPSAVS